jgi:integrase
MSVRKREWGPPGQRKSAWIATITDAAGKRRQETFKHKKEADKWEDEASIQVRAGTHVADSASATVAKAGEFWIAATEEAGRERGTLAQYRQHLDIHIKPFIGNVRLSRLTAPAVREFATNLRKEGRSPDMVKRVVSSLGALLGDALDRGLVAQNVARGRRRGNGRQAELRHKEPLAIGVDIPKPEEIRAIIAAAKGRWRPLLVTAIFTGLRSSELRGLAWPAVDLDQKKLHVRQRADRYNLIGPPKSVASRRTLPLSPFAVETLREWRRDCPKGDLNLVFPTGPGNIESRANIIARGLIPTVIAAGLTVPALGKDGQPRRDKNGQPILTAKYTGLHALRHFYASLLINRKVVGGLELPLKTVQQRMGHSKLQMTMDTYGHLFPSGDVTEEMDAMDRALQD